MSEPHTATSLSLLQRLRESDNDAWSRLVHLYGPLIRHWAARRGVTGADADDVTQEVFKAVAGGLAQFRRDRPGDTFRGWLHGVTRNVLLRHAERANRQPRGSGGTAALVGLNAVPDAADAEPDSPAELGALYRRGLELVKGEFEARTWQMFWRHVVGERSPAEVAAEMGVSPAAVRQAKSRVLRRLKEELGDLGEGPHDVSHPADESGTGT
jgi:RNA polymerase sigma-70 factor (ECF subfamily)